MPLFFLISGFLFKPLNNLDEYKKDTKKRAKQLLIPYFSFFIFIFFTDFIFDIVRNQVDIRLKILEIGEFLFGGQQAIGLYVVFWFTTCLFITYSLFSFIVLKFKDVKIQITIVLLLFIIAHIESWINSHYINISIPWNADVSLLTMTYFAIGYYIKIFSHKISHKITIFLCLTFTIIFINIDMYTLFDYTLDLKYLIYNNLVLDLFVPLIFSFLILYFSYFISRYRFSRLFSLIGRSSMTIMYLHIMIKYVMDVIDVTGIYSTFLYTFFGILIPLLISLMILNKYNFLRFIFLGMPIRE